MALLGRNGAGKSSLMKIIFGSMKADCKAVRINGITLPHVQRLGNVPQITYLPQDMFIPDYISIKEAFKLFDIDLAILNEFPDLKKLLNNKAHDVSGGERRLIETMLILFSKSEFSLLDEPFTGLSPVAIERVLELIQKAKKRKGIIITDHYHRYVRAAADTLYFLVNGRTHRIKEADDLVRYGYL